jgi:hypothetical protein
MLAATRIGRLTFDCIKDDAWARLDEAWTRLNQRLAVEPPRRGRTDCAHLTDDQIIRRMIELGCLTWGDIKPRATQ